jgi:hypothetical protein
MLSAGQARAKAQNDLIIFGEVRDIEEAILTAIAAGNYNVDVVGTVMTSTTDGVANARLYFNGWQGITPDRSKEIQMNQVITYFTDLGYTIERKTNALTGDTFKWTVLW